MYTKIIGVGSLMTRGIVFIMGFIVTTSIILMVCFLVILLFPPSRCINRNMQLDNNMLCTDPTPKIFALHEAFKPVKNITFGKNIRAGLPIRLSIPKIHIDAHLERVGLTPDGAMDIPKMESNAAWFHLGPRPGEIGNAVIDGHYGIWKNGKISVFNNLHRLLPGDKIYIEDQSGIILTFIVRESRVYRENSIVPEIFISNDRLSHLNLITCQGVWNNRKKNYSDRLVVFADRIW